MIIGALRPRPVPAQSCITSGQVTRRAPPHLTSPHLSLPLSPSHSGLAFPLTLSLLHTTVSFITRVMVNVPLSLFFSPGSSTLFVTLASSCVLLSLTSPISNDERATWFFLLIYNAYFPCASSHLASPSCYFYFIISYGEYSD